MSPKARGFFFSLHGLYVSGDALVGSCAYRAARLSVFLPCGFPDAGAYVLKTSRIPILSYQDNSYNPIQYNPIHPKRLLGACKNYVVHSWDFSRFVPSHGVHYSWRSPMHYVVCVRVCVPGITLPFPCFAGVTLCFSCFCVSACMHTFVMEFVCVCVCVCVCTLSMYVPFRMV